MPIVDGLTATKMIRSFEKSHPKLLQSTRAAAHGRVPIFAVSASLVERERKTYIDAGFDGWILKPVSFDRLQTLMNGIVDKQTRSRNVYRPGLWEFGGWFESAQPDIFAANTKPAGEVPTKDSSKGVHIAAASDGPLRKEEESSTQSEEQLRLLKEQERLSENR